MKPIIVALTLLAASCQASRVEQIALDLSRPQQSFALTATEYTDVTIAAALRVAGADFDPAGWAGLLWVGTAEAGITITNASVWAGGISWDITVPSMPTNGRYSVLVFGAISNRVEEWGRGTLTVRPNPARSSLPPEWRSGDAAFIAATNAQAIAAAVADLPRIEARETNGVYSLFIITQ